VSLVRVQYGSPLIKYAGVAELADALDLGSSAFGVGVRLPSPAPHADVAQLVEHNLAKVGVASSSLVVRSIKTMAIFGRGGGTGRRTGLKILR
jgi:hypothetical protein